MNSDTIKDILAKDTISRAWFGGVHPADWIIDKKPSFDMFIINTEQVGLPGEHWVLFYVPPKGSAEFFDSAGNPPKHYKLYFEEYLFSVGRRYLYNPRALQGILSNTCGLYCILFIVLRSRGYTFDEIMGLFSNNSYQNDEFVGQFVQNFVDILSC